MGIVERGADGGVNINIYSLATFVDGELYDKQNPETGDTLSVPAGKTYSLRMMVENNGGTGFLSPDNCSNGKGTLLTAVFRVPEGDTLTNYVDGPVCHFDKGFFGGDPGRIGYWEEGLSPRSQGESVQVDFYVRGGETGDRMTPIYFLNLTATEQDGQPGSGTGDNGDETDDGGGGDEPFEEYRVDVTDCDVPDQIAAGEQFRVDYRVENTNDQPATITVDVIADGGANFGTLVLEQATFDLPANYYQNRYVTPPAPTYEGDIDIAVEVSNASQQ
jgi:hypothetical protein